MMFCPYGLIGHGETKLANSRPILESKVGTSSLDRNIFFKQAKGDIVIKLRLILKAMIVFFENYVCIESFKLFLR